MYKGESVLQNLFDAEVIVAGGRGAVGDNMLLVKELAKAFQQKGIKAEKIIAIDHNSKASIFRYVDFGIVGEYQDVVPELIERVGEILIEK